MTDYRKFLGGAAATEVVAPYFGGSRVDLLERRVRLAATGEVAPGWWRFQIAGRTATPLAPAEPPALGKLPAVRGAWCAGYVFASGRDVERIALPPADEPPPLARCIARRWPSRDLVFDALDFDDEPELAARRALEDRTPLGEIRGMTPALRFAFGFAVAAAAGQRIGIAVTPRELAPHAVAIAEGGDAEPILRGLAATRERAALQRAAHRIAVLRPHVADPIARAEAALDAAGARMVACRQLAGDQLEVRFDFGGERFTTIVFADTLQVIDTNICLDGADSEVTLESLPSVIREGLGFDWPTAAR